MKKVVMYINQFFGQIGGEEKADIGPQLREGPVGPAVALNGLLQDAQITHTRRHRIFRICSAESRSICLLLDQRFRRDATVWPAGRFAKRWRRCFMFRLSPPCTSKIRE